MSEAVAILIPLIKELCEYLVRMEENLATIEKFMDEVSLKRIEKSLAEYKKPEYITATNAKDIRKALMKD